MISFKKKVLLRAPLLTVSGYGVHCRQIFEYLYNRIDIDLTVQVLNWGATPWMIDKNSEDGIIEKIMMCSKPVTGKFDLSVQVQLPDEWDINLAHQNIGVSAFVETDLCNPKWLEKVNTMNEVIVPSRFIKKVINNTGKTIKNIEVIPEHYNYNIDKKNAIENFSFDKKFNFLVLGQLTGDKPENDRKNIENMIKWYCEAFENNKSVNLILKTNSGRCSLADRTRTLRRVQAIVNRVRIGKYPSIDILHGNLTSKEISGLFKDNKVKCLLSATRGEGYGLPLVDAAAAAMPVVAPPYSGHMEFLEEKNICSLNYKLHDIPVNRVDERIFMKGSKWAEVDGEDFKNKILDVYENYSVYRKKAQRMQQNIRNNFSREAVFEKYDQFFEKYLG
jgi:glycosyltransferase involved in cell wall biosynthesis